MKTISSSKRIAFHLLIACCLCLFFTGCGPNDPEICPDSKNSFIVLYFTEDCQFSSSVSVQREQGLTIRVEGKIASWANQSRTIWFEVKKPSGELIIGESQTGQTIELDDVGEYQWNMQYKFLSTDTEPYYTITAKIKQSNGSTYSSQVTVSFSATNEKLIAWSGRGQWLNFNEQLLSFTGAQHFYYGYALAVQAVDASGNPMNGVSVTFSSPDPVSFSPSTWSTSTLTGVDGTNKDGMATTLLSYTGPSVLTVATITASATINGNPVSTTFSIFYRDDLESSGQPSGSQHEKNGSTEVPGDDIADTYETGAEQTQKDVEVEVDYTSDFARIADLPAILDEVKNIWSPYGVHLKLSIGNAITSMSSSIDRTGAKTVLRNNRTDTRAIHVVIGKGASSNFPPASSITLGVTVQYYGAPPSGENYFFLDCANLASGDPSFRSGNPSNATFLNSTGCFIFSTHIENSNYSSLPSNSWGTGSALMIKVYAWTIAHEIGHALGVWKHTNNDPVENLPNEISLIHNLDASDSYQNYTKILPRSLKFVNTRNKLGVETVDFRY